MTDSCVKSIYHTSKHGDNIWKPNFYSQLTNHLSHIKKLSTYAWSYEHVTVHRRFEKI